MVGALRSKSLVLCIVKLYSVMCRVNVCGDEFCAFHALTLLAGTAPDPLTLSDEVLAWFPPPLQ